LEDKFTVPAGDCKLSLATQFSTAVTTLKGPRTCLFDYVPAVR
jgi:hypothetical protein